MKHMKFNPASDHEITDHVSDCGRYRICKTRITNGGIIRVFYACRVDGVIFKAGLSTFNEAVQHCLRRKNA